MAEVAEPRPDEHARWTAGADVVGGDVETLDDLGKRVADALREAAADWPRPAARSWWPPTAPRPGRASGTCSAGRGSSCARCGPCRTATGSS